MTHPTITKALAMQLAREAGATFYGEQEVVFNKHSDFVRLIKLVRNAGLEEAKQVCLAKSRKVNSHWIPIDCADEIESLKDNTP